MGIPGILKEIGKGERIALAKLAVEHLERTQRPLRIAIDAAIWNFQTQAGQGGKNPALRILYYRLLRILALPIHPLFVYDGKNKPLVKRGKAVSRWGSCIANETSKRLLQHFQFPCHVAPGEAEAECALLQKEGLVDMVMSQDGDAIMFGSNITLRDWSKEGARGNKSPTHVNLLDLPRIKERSGLNPDGMILVALLSGGDYDQDGLPGFGAGLACEIARAGFGEDLLELIKMKDNAGLAEWRERLQYELESNESGYFKRKHKTLTIPDSFPDRALLGYYTQPAVSKVEDLSKLESKWTKIWDAGIDVREMRDYVGQTFDWLYKPGAWKFVRGMAPSLLAHKLRLSMADQYVKQVEQISERRQHFSNDGIPELRLSVIPGDIVGIDLDAEEDSPEYLESLKAEQAEEVDEVDTPDDARQASEEPSATQNIRKQRKAPIWRPRDAEKIWLPKTIIKLGVPALVEEWEQKQRDMLADPKKFATRKARLAHSKTAPVVSRPLEHFFKVSKPVVGIAVPRTEVPESIPVPALLENTKAQGQSIIEFCARPSARVSGSAHAPITLSSSPVQTVSAPATPVKIRKTTTDILQAVDTDGLPSSVTRRRRRASHGRSGIASSPQASPQKQPRSIASFFLNATRDAEKANEEGSIRSTKPPETTIPPVLSTGLKTAMLSKRVVAVPRESLPGSWQVLDLDEEIVSTKTKRSNRVSYVDLFNG